MRVRLLFLMSAAAAVLTFGGNLLLADGQAGKEAAEVRPRGYEQPGAAGDAAAAPKGADAVAEEEKPYQIVCEAVNTRRECKVDQQTFVGWRTFHGFCAQCHAQDAVGSTFAPSLLTRLQQVDRERFEYVVANGFTGQMGVMPGFKDNPNVMPRVDELYAYLSARADGVLPPGRPARLPRE